MSREPRQNSDDTLLTHQTHHDSCVRNKILLENSILPPAVNFFYFTQRVFTRSIDIITGLKQRIAIHGKQLIAG